MYHSPQCGGLGRGMGCRFFQNVLSILSKAFYFFFPNSGSIFRNAVTTNVMRQQTITMMKNF